MEEELPYFINRVFEKLWASVTPEKFQNFPDLKSILRYLQMCVHSVLVDTARRLEANISLDETVINQNQQENTQSIENQISTQLAAGELWKMIERKLKNEAEKQVIYGTFVLGQKPNELCLSHKESLGSVEAVYRIKERVLSRLSRDQELKDYFTNV
jgi:hypothetical protein